MSTPNPGQSTASKQSPSVWEIFYPREIQGHRDEIFLASFPEIMYFWPTVLTLFLCALLQSVGGSPGAVGWIFFLIFSFNLLVLVQDFDQKKFFIFLLLVFVGILGIWIINLYGFTFIQRIASWILGFSPALSTDAYVLLGMVTLVYFVWGCVAPMFSYWKLEQNEFIHYTQPIGKDMSIARIGCSVYKEIPDIFECILSGGGGSLIIRKDNQVLATIPNVPFLGMRMKAIEHMLSETRVIVDKEV